MGKLTISMAIFNSKPLNHQRVGMWSSPQCSQDPRRDTAVEWHDFSCCAQLHIHIQAWAVQGLHLWLMSVTATLFCSLFPSTQPEGINRLVFLCCCYSANAPLCHMLSRWATWNLNAEQVWMPLFSVATRSLIWKQVPAARNHWRYHLQNRPTKQKHFLVAPGQG